ncbi:MAG TPA: chemotaxis protein CheD [Dongiaceae bacterium]|nr:chemotaxis protein CheD [Dongiaceae bacterium]
MQSIDAPLIVHPGEWYFGRAPARVCTLLGSCVAVTVWHPVLRCGGLCHYLLPRPPGNAAPERPDPRYGVFALNFLRHHMEQHSPLQEYEIGCYGGSDMFSGRIRSRIGEINLDFATQWLHRHHLTPGRQNVGGSFSRNITLDLTTGNIQLKRYSIDSAPETPHDNTSARGR